MERSLRLDLFRSALGAVDGVGEDPAGIGLPSPASLAAEVAVAERELLAGRGDVGPELLRVGWYLHAVASSHAAVERYGVGRQRDAFRVASHVFDLSLASNAEESPDWDDVFRRCFAAQIASYRSDLDPNSIALYRRETARYEAQTGLSRYELTIVDDLDRVALVAGMALLGADVSGVFGLTRTVRAEVRSLEAAWGGVEVWRTPFGAPAGVVEGVNSLVVYLLYGDTERLEVALAQLESVVNGPHARGNKDARWVAAQLLDIAGYLDRSSVRSVLPPGTPESVARAFSMDPPVLTLWPPQVEFIRPSDGRPGVLSPESRRAVVAAPTSAGKTLVAQLLIAAHRSLTGTGVCYVAPTRSLCREVKRSLDRRLRFLSDEVAADQPTWSAPTTAAVEVMTQERLAHLLRMEGSAVLERYGLFVFDEVHNLSDGTRGWALESDIAFLHERTLETDHRMVMLSAAMSNTASFATWLDPGGGVDIHTSEWRGPRQVHALWTARPDRDAPESVVRPKARQPQRTRYPLKGTLTIRTGLEHPLVLAKSEPVGHVEYVEGGGRDNGHSTAAYRTLVPLIIHLAQFGQVLTVDATKAGVARIAGAVAEVASDEWGTSSFLYDLVREQLGEGHPLTTAVRAGVGFHHGSLPADVRAAVEDAVTAGVLRVLVSTTTLTDGVNLPVRSIVVASRGTFREGAFDEYISGAKLLNAVGRAGRAAQETEGVVVIATRPGRERQDLTLFAPTTEDLEVRSTLASAAALSDLARLLDAVRDGTDALYAQAGTVVAGFVSYIWFVAAELERLAQDVNDEAVDTVLGRTLAWIQLGDERREAWRALARTTVAEYVATAPRSRARWSASGAGLGTARALEAMAAEIALIVPDDVSTTALGGLDLVLRDGRLERILALPDAPGVSVWDRRGGGRSPIVVDVRAFLDDWVAGTEIRALSDAHLGAVPDETFRLEQAVDYVGAVFDLYLPWVIRTVASWANEAVLARRSEEGIVVFDSDPHLIPDEVAALVQRGVNSVTALSLMLGGVLSRRLATDAAKAWAESGIAQDVSLRGWLGAMAVGEWVERFKPTPSELRDLLTFVRARANAVSYGLIAGDEVEIPFLAETLVFDERPVRLAIDERDGQQGVVVVDEDDVVGYIHSRYQQDLEGIVAGGYLLDASAWVVGGEGLLRCRLVDP